jgi:hypothetical protein
MKWFASVFVVAILLVSCSNPIVLTMTSVRFINNQTFDMQCYIDNIEVGTALSHDVLEVENVAGGIHRVKAIGMVTFPGTTLIFPYLWGPYTQDLKAGGVWIFTM